MDSILTSVKKMLGIEADYTHFDQDIVMHINSVFMILRQLGVGPAGGFVIEDATATWTDFLGDSTDAIAVKTYVYQKVKMVFDPPVSSAAATATTESIKELEWRLNAAAETPIG